MTPKPFEIRLQASLLKDGATISPEIGSYMADRLVSFTAQAERTAHELRVAASQLVADVREMTGCTEDERVRLRGLADFMMRHADDLAPIGSVFDPGDKPAPNVVRLKTRPDTRLVASGVDGERG